MEVRLARPYQGSYEIQVKPATDGIGSAGKHGKRYPLIVGVKKTVELRSTGMQPLRHLGLADVLLFHRLAGGTDQRRSMALDPIKRV